MAGTMTPTQKQCLLRYLGYYTGAVDGIWGSASRKAAVDFQNDWDLPEDPEFGDSSQERIREAILKPGNWWQKIRWWDREEFRCRCGGKFCNGFPAEPVRALVELAEQVRCHFGKPGIASSGLRCPNHNKACGGVENSRHLAGKALDFRIRDVNSRSLLAYVQTLPGVRYAYAIDDSYVHMDIE